MSMSPYLLLAFLLGATNGALFHLWQGKNVRDLAIYFLTGVIGFGLGQMLANLMGINIFLIGPLHVVTATIVSWATLFIVKWLKI